MLKKDFRIAETEKIPITYPGNCIKQKAGIKFFIPAGFLKD
jgi:hypothetical protein